MIAAPGFEFLEGGLGLFDSFEIERGTVAVAAAGLLLGFESARGTIGSDDGGEGAAGGDEEGFHGESEVADYVETRVGCVDCCSAEYKTNGSAGDTAFEGDIVVGFFFFFGEDFHCEDWLIGFFLIGRLFEELGGIVLIEAQLSIAGLLES